MKKFNKDKLMGISVVGVLMIVAVLVGIKLYETTIPEKYVDQIILTEESDVLVDNLELEEPEVIEEETKLNITISESEEVQLIEGNENKSSEEGSGNTGKTDETVEGKTLVVVKEEEAKVPEVPTVADEEILTDSSKEPEYEEEPVVEENQEVEGNVVNIEIETKNENDIPAGVNITPAEDSENPFLNPPTEIESGIKGETDSTKYSEDGVWGTGEKF